MSATTKAGRTRNRRTIPPSNAPDGYPILLAMQFIELVTASQFRMQCIGLDGNAWPVDTAPAINGVAQIKGQGSGITYSCTLNQEPSESTWLLTVTAGGVPVAGDDLYFRPWQQAVRGTNGEWIGPFNFTIPL